MRKLLFGLLCAVIVLIGSVTAGSAPDPLLTMVGIGVAFAGILANQAQAAAITKLLDPASAANTAAATSAWVDVTKLEGDVEFIVHAGAITGSIVWTVEDATDSGGTGGAGITPNEGAFAAVTANQVQKRTVNASACRGFMRVVGTIVTGPVFVAGSLQGHPKYT